MGNLTKGVLISGIAMLLMVYLVGGTVMFQGINDQIMEIEHEQLVYSAKQSELAGRINSIEERKKAIETKLAFQEEIVRQREIASQSMEGIQEMLDAIAKLDEEYEQNAGSTNLATIPVIKTSSVPKKSSTGGSSSSTSADTTPSSTTTASVDSSTTTTPPPAATPPPATTPPPTTTTSAS